MLDVKEPPCPCHISSTIEMVEGIKQIDRQACKICTHVVGICIEEGPTMGASWIWDSEGQYVEGGKRFKRAPSNGIFFLFFEVTNCRIESSRIWKSYARPSKIWKIQ